MSMTIVSPRAHLHLSMYVYLCVCLSYDISHMRFGLIWSAWQMSCKRDFAHFSYSSSYFFIYDSPSHYLPNSISTIIDTEGELQILFLFLWGVQNGHSCKRGLYLNRVWLSRYFSSLMKLWNWNESAQASQFYRAGRNCKKFRDVAKPLQDVRAPNWIKEVARENFMLNLMSLVFIICS